MDGAVPKRGHAVGERSRKSNGVRASLPAYRWSNGSKDDAMATLIKFYAVWNDNLRDIWEIMRRDVHKDLVQFPADTVVGAEQPRLYCIGGRYYILAEVMVDTPDPVPVQALGFWNCTS